MNSLPPGMLRQKREQAGLSPEKVVDELAKKGISINVKTLYGYENGVSTPRVNTFIALCSIYRVTDIMGEFGYTTPIKLASGNSEWTYGEYNDFFNANLLEKIYILLEKGVPSFSGYESQLEKCFPPNSKDASFNRLYTLFSALDEQSQAAVFHTISDLNGNPYGCTEDIDFITLFHRASNEDKNVILYILDKYRDKSLEEYLNYHIKDSTNLAAATPNDKAEALKIALLAYTQYLSEKKQASQASSAPPSAEKLA